MRCEKRAKERWHTLLLDNKCIILWFMIRADNIGAYCWIGLNENLERVEGAGFLWCGYSNIKKKLNTDVKLIRWK